MNKDNSKYALKILTTKIRLKKCFNYICMYYKNIKLAKHLHILKYLKEFTLKNYAWYCRLSIFLKTNRN